MPFTATSPPLSTTHRQNLKLWGVIKTYHPTVYAQVDLKSASSISDALMDLDFECTDLKGSIEAAKPDSVVAAENQLKAEREAAKEAAAAEALAKSPENLLKAKAAKAAEEAEEAEEEDDMVCISRRPPLTHNLTHSTPLPPFRRCPTSPTRSRVPPWKVRAAAASPRRRRPRR